MEPSWPSSSKLPQSSFASPALLVWLLLLSGFEALMLTLASSSSSIIIKKGSLGGFTGDIGFFASCCWCPGIIIEFGMAPAAMTPPGPPAWLYDGIIGPDWAAAAAKKSPIPPSSWPFFSSSPFLTFLNPNSDSRWLVMSAKNRRSPLLTRRCFSVELIPGEMPKAEPCAAGGGCGDCCCIIGAALRWAGELPVCFFAFCCCCCCLAVIIICRFISAICLSISSICFFISSGLILAYWFIMRGFIFVIP
mmetsp:Transcript_4852/g.11572  ORF Transcript_4852/g.11572 Transcript_4852/m.11572 type:complete len:249 (+) Transcript_4852:102-848(+)